MKYLYSIGVLLLIMFSAPLVHATSLSTGCNPGDNFSATTGFPCTVPNCNPGDLFSGVTGKPCSHFLPGCYSLNGYSITTGTKCDTINNQTISNMTTLPQGTTVTNPLTITFSAPELMTYWSPTYNRIYGTYTITDPQGDASDIVPSIAVDGVVQSAVPDHHDPQNNSAVFRYSLNLSAGVHTLTVAANGVTQVLTFSVPPYIQDQPTGYDITIQ